MFQAAGLIIAAAFADMATSAHAPSRSAIHDRCVPMLSIARVQMQMGREMVCVQCYVPDTFLSERKSESTCERFVSSAFLSESPL